MVSLQFTRVGSEGEEREERGERWGGRPCRERDAIGTRGERRDEEIREMGTWEERLRREIERRVKRVN